MKGWIIIMIQFKNVYKRYDSAEVVKDFSLNVNEGEFFVLIGPSGCGKTTTLKMINQLTAHSEGSITIEGKGLSEYNLQELRWNIGYVLQQIALFPNMTVEENIVVVPEMKKWSKDKMKERVTELLDNVGLEPQKYRGRKISQLSGGEQQRIGVVRALAADPDIILMDEPFSALDPISRSSLQEDVLKLQRQLKKTVVFVTHDMQEAITLADRICVMNEGAIEQIGTAEEILKKPANDFVREFLRTGLPHYKEDKHVQQIIDEGFFTKETKEVQESIEATDTIDSLTLKLSKHPIVHVHGLESAQNYSITQADLISYFVHTQKADASGLKEARK